MTLRVSGYFDEYDLITDIFRLSGEPFSYIKEMDVKFLINNSAGITGAM